MFTKLFWKDTAERAISTVAQVLVTILAVDGVNLLTIDLMGTLAACATAGVLVVLKCIIAATARKETPTISPASALKDSRGYVQ